MSEYEEIRQRVTRFSYVATKKEGAAAHPDCHGIGLNAATYRGSRRYNKQLDAYIEAIYGVTKEIP